MFETQPALPINVDRGKPGNVIFRKVAGVTGLEPAASGVTGRRSNQLSYTPSEEAAKAVCPWRKR